MKEIFAEMDATAYLFRRGFNPFRYRNNFIYAFDGKGEGDLFISIG